MRTTHVSGGQSRPSTGLYGQSMPPNPSANEIPSQPQQSNNSVNRATVVSWNVNGLRAVVNNKSLNNFFKAFPGAVAFCLQETKLSSIDDVEESIALRPGYNSFWSVSRRKKGWSGVATFAKAG